MPHGALAERSAPLANRSGSDIQVSVSELVHALGDVLVKGVRLEIHSISQTTSRASGLSKFWPHS